MTSFAVGLLIGSYLGIGIGAALFSLAEVGLAGGLRLLWRIPLLVLFWPGLFAAAIASAR